MTILGIRCNPFRKFFFCQDHTIIIFIKLYIGFYSFWDKDISVEIPFVQFKVNQSVFLLVPTRISRVTCYWVQHKVIWTTLANGSNLCWIISQKWNQTFNKYFLESLLLISNSCIHNVENSHTWKIQFWLGNYINLQNLPFVALESNCQPFFFCPLMTLFSF